jgi:putative peptidoglycan lipid II flippase
MTVDPVLNPAIAAPELEPALESALVQTASVEPPGLSEPSEPVAAGLARATTILAIGNVASRVLGFAKEILLSNYFGAGRLVDAFQIAITIPQDLYDLALSGHVNSALVPVLSEYAVKDRAELWRLVSALLGLICLAASVLVLGLEVFAPQVIAIWRGTEISAEAFNLSVYLLRLTSPALLFLSLFALASGLLYALKRFTWPAFAAALFNGTVVVAIVLLAPVIGIEGAAIGVVLAAILQLALQFGGLRGAQLRLQLRGALQHPGVRRIGILYVPVLISLVLDVLINRPFSYNMASQAGDGIIAYMNWATSLREFPMGLVGTAISIAILPTLARQALRADMRQQFKDTLGLGIRLALTLIIPAAVGMFVLSGPLIGLLFEHGAFTAANTAAMSVVLRLYLLGIPFAAIDLLLIFAFYAVKDTLTPALVGIFSLACYIGIATALYPRYGFLSLMIADSSKHLIHMTVSFVLLRRRQGSLGSQNLPRTLVKVTLATVVMALVTYAVARSVPELWPIMGLTQRAILVILPAALGAATYFILASLLRVSEFTGFVQAVGQKLHR